MILIYSQKSEPSTNDVMDWLEYLGAVDTLRINGEDSVSALNVQVDAAGVKVSLELKYSNKSTSPAITLSNLDSYWYRRGELHLQSNGLHNKENLPFINYLNVHIRHDHTECEHFLTRYLEGSARVKIGSYYKGDVNKPELLNIAASLGLNIPETLMTQSKAELMDFVANHAKVIIKPLANSYNPRINNKSYSMYTSIVNDEVLTMLPDTFSLSFFQRYIPKKYEIRVFYLNGACYSMAIFSQGNAQTEIDFRRYDRENPNRFLPYKLPDSLEVKIQQLMQRAGLESGSLDFIYSTDNNYYFLEVNPVGQFGMVSSPCNYHLEKLIALTLLNGNKQ